MDWKEELRRCCWKPFLGRSNDLVRRSPSDELLDPLPELALAQLAPLAWQAGGELGDPYSTLLTRLISQIPSSKWVNVDEQMRMSDHSIPFADQLRKAERNFKSGPEWIVLGLCHASGRIRESALQRIDTVEPGIALCLLAVRANDWVPAIRSQAMDRLESLFASSSSGSRLFALPALIRLREAWRHQSHARIESMLQALARRFDGQEWFDVWSRSSGRDRSAYVDLMIRSRHAPSGNLLDVLIACNDRRILLWLLRDVMPALDHVKQESLRQVIRRSRVAALKRAWFDWLRESQPEELWRPELASALFDTGKSIRQYARFHLAAGEKMDFSEIYRNGLGDPRLEVVALAGLMEVDPEAAHLEALVRLDSDIPAIRRVAILALSEDWLGSEISTALGWLESPVPGVAKAIGKRLLPLARQVGADWIGSANLRSHASPAIRRWIVSHADRFQKWDGLEALLRELRKPVPIDSAESGLARWRESENRSFVRLPPPRRALLEQLMASVRLPPPTLQSLKFLLSRAE